jgi:hypothetical protein
VISDGPLLQLATVNAYAQYPILGTWASAQKEVLRAWLPGRHVTTATAVGFSRATGSPSHVTSMARRRYPSHAIAVRS